jgi:hypothetical protein
MGLGRRLGRKWGGCWLRGAAQRKEEGRSPGSIVPHGGGWHRGAGSRQGVRPVEAVAGRAYATRAGEWGSVCGLHVSASAGRGKE